MKKTLLAATLALSFSAAAQAAPAPGSLVIVGGALTLDNTAVYQSFLDLAGGAEKARIGILPAATANISKYSKQLTAVLAELGLPPERVEILPIAVKDDKKTDDIDESSWANNGKDPALAEQVKDLTGIWFLGGDQTRITQTLLDDEGADTPVLAAIRDVYAKGGVVAGTSAGAAIMSSTMIAGGNSTGALLSGFKQDYTSMDEQEYGPVIITRGLGFFDHGVIDQHFDRKARLGRLVVVSLAEKAQGGAKLAYGVDENTALVLRKGSEQLDVVGENGVTVVDVSQATQASDSFPTRIENVRLSFLSQGDSIDLATGEYSAREGAYGTKGYEYFNVPEPSISGIVSANRDLDQFLGFDLMDNEAVTSVSSYVFTPDGHGVQLTFSQDDASEGYWNQNGSADIYTFKQVRMDIEPIQVQISYLKDMAAK